MPYVSFIPAPGCLAAAAGLVTPLRTCSVDPRISRDLAGCPSVVFPDVVHAVLNLLIELFNTTVVQ